MTADLLYALLGLIILLLAGDSLVKGAVNLSLRMGIPALIVSLTIVAFGTSAPELLIAIKAVLDNAPGIALGNVVGSNTANVLLVLGVPAIISGLKTDECDTRRNYIFMLLATILFIVICFLGPITWVHGLVLLAALAFVLGDALRSARQHRRDVQNGADVEDDEEEDLEGVDPTLPGWKIALFLVLGLVGLPLGADLLVDSSINIATVLGVSETVIGLTLVAVGTSLPELATTVMAAMRKQADVALGNVIGSNMFNLLAIIGVTGLVGALPIPPQMLRFDLWVMLASSLVLVPFVFRGWNMTWKWGIALTGLYGAYVLSVLI
ncbi:calcium/sodium antiporter [Actibacterium lipolyticum]|uniref:Inner membrane protein YrbG n=1 Tax=Actibacterium lipolyticum TaxID=1524263 RepID=A0A238KSR3_9RHOB|nr:calcium/sodium antiporter [Actibacterium lipolyticum]SMX45873.1 Inner membrane protein YrbG [Actibacterium lipolyticum]